MAASFDASKSAPHRSVLYQQVLSALRPSAGGRHIDGTVGAGGHAAGILEAASPGGELLGIDRDPEAIELAKSRLGAFSDRVHLRQGSYAAMRELAGELGWDRVDGILLDLGLSSMQLDEPGRGFSFREEGPLDMRFDPSQPTRAEDLVNELPEGELADLLWRFGEERKSRAVARAIMAARPLHTTLELAAVVGKAVGRSGGRIHPATRTFQALRIAVNGELDELETGLDQSIDMLRPGGRLAVVAFHSLEDRIVKHFLRREARDCICPPGQAVCTCDHVASMRVLTKKPVRPDDQEQKENPRARSARLRVGERLDLA